MYDVIIKNARIPQGNDTVVTNMDLNNEHDRFNLETALKISKILKSC